MTAPIKWRARLDQPESLTANETRDTETKSIEGNGQSPLTPFDTTVPLSDWWNHISTMIIC